MPGHLTLPTWITLLRFILVPVLVWWLVQANWSAALLTFVLAGVSDWLDGYLARRLQLQSEIGALLDPLADKAMMLAASAMLLWLELIPWWLGGAIILRDLLIVSGGVMYRWHVGPVEIAPTRLGKLNTLLEFALLAAVMLRQTLAADWQLLAAYMFLLCSILLSGGHYVWLWADKARQHWHARKS